jgi:hypothetical protein
MKEKYPSGQPCDNYRASICSWELEFSFLTREQCLKFINLWLTEFLPPTKITYQENSDDTHSVLIENGGWAHNLTRLAELLELCDYNAGCE